MELPASFIDYTRALLGDEEYDKLAVALQQEPPVSIRLNQLKINHSLSDKVPWSSEGFYLEERLTFTFDPLFHAGCYYVQESFFHVCGAGTPAIYHGTGEDVGSLCGSRWKIDSCP